MAVTDLAGTTWILNYIPETESYSGPSNLTVEASIAGYPSAGHSFYINLAYDTSGIFPFTSGVEITNGETGVLWTDISGWTDEETNPLASIEYRTITFYGGMDTTRASFISWLENNATQVLVPSGGVTITYGDSTLTTLSSDTTIKLSTKHKWMGNDINVSLELPEVWDGSYTSGGGG